jgi:hypothetical protein
MTEPCSNHETDNLLKSFFGNRLQKDQCHGVRYVGKQVMKKHSTFRLRKDCEDGKEPD